MDFRHITIKLSEGAHRAFKGFCVSVGKSMQEVITTAIMTIVEDKEIYGGEEGGKGEGDNAS